MRTKGEILKSITHFSLLISDGAVALTIPEIYKAMDEYAKERSIAFAEWCDRNEFTQCSDGLWYTDLDRFEVRGYTTAELYELFTKENQDL